MNKKVDKFILTFIIAECFFLTLNALWMVLEIWMLGGVKNNAIDNIIAIPIFISFWFNAKSIVNRLELRRINKDNS